MGVNLGLRRRSTGDLLVLMIGATVCFVVIAGGAAVFVIELVDRDAETAVAVKSLHDIVNTLLGLVAGFVAGRAHGRRPLLDDDELDDEHDELNDPNAP